MDILCTSLKAVKEYVATEVTTTNGKNLSHYIRNTIRVLLAHKYTDGNPTHLFGGCKRIGCN